MLLKLLNKQPTIKNKKNILNDECWWCKITLCSVNVDFHGDPFPPPPDPTTTPYQYFKSFLDDDLIDVIAEQTNTCNLKESGVSIAVTHDEIQQYIGILIMMAFVKLPRQQMYWSQHTQILALANTMFVKRFEKIKKYIHFCDDNIALPKTHSEFFQVIQNQASPGKCSIIL